MEATPERLWLSVPSHPQYLCVVRSFVERLLHTLGFGRADVDGMVLAIHEAYTNIIKYGYEGDTSRPIDLTVLVTPEALAIEIRDYGKRQDVTTIKPRALHEVRPGGLGTHFIQAMMDEVTYHSSDTGTVVRMTKRRSVSCASS